MEIILYILNKSKLNIEKMKFKIPKLELTVEKKMIAQRQSEVYKNCMNSPKI